MRKYFFAICMALGFALSAQVLPKTDQLDKVVRVKFKADANLQLNSQKNSFNAVGSYLALGNEVLDGLNQRYLAQEMRRVFPYAGKFESKHQRYGLHLWYDIYVGTNTSIADLITSYGDIDIIDAAESVQVYSLGMDDATQSTNDPQLSDQWHYNNTGQTGGLESADISLFEAWEEETGDSRVIVSVHDSGIDLTHPDLDGVLWTNDGETPNDGVDNDNNGFIDDYYGYNFAAEEVGGAPSSVQDYNGHGTHTSGTIAAENNNGIGVSGIAGGSGSNDGVRIMMMRLGDDYGSSSIYNPAPSFVYAADMGAVVSSNSWGGGSYDQSVYDAIEYFVAEAGSGSQALSGGLVVFSSGNSSSSSEDYKAAIDGVVMVSATNHEDQLSWYSNYGTWVDISAPGGETSVSDQGVLSTIIGSSYAFYQGTSMACPHVAGVAALMVSKAYGTGLTRSELEEALLSSTDPIDDLNPSYSGLLGSGRLNAKSALDAMASGGGGSVGGLIIEPIAIATEIRIGAESETYVVKIVNTSQFDVTVDITDPNVDWLEIEVPNISVASNSTGKFEVTLSANESGGLLTNEIVFSYPSLSSLQTQSLPVSVYTLDAPNLSSVDTIYFDDLYPRQEFTEQFTLSNIGTDYVTLQEAGVSTVHYDFDFQEVLLSPGAYQDYNIAFTPESSGFHIDSILFQSSDADGLTHKIVLMGTAKSTSPPKLSLSTNEINLDLAEPTYGTTSFTITNEGEDPLIYNLYRNEPVFDTSSDNGGDETNDLGSYRKSIDSPIDEVQDLAWDGNYLWLADANSNYIFKFDIATETILDSISSIADYGVAIAIDGQYLWEHDQGTQLIKYDITSGAVVSQIALNSSENYYAGITVDAQSVWLTKYYYFTKYNKLTGENEDEYYNSSLSDTRSMEAIGNSIFTLRSYYLYQFEKEASYSSSRVSTIAGLSASDGSGLAYDGHYMWSAFNSLGKLIYFEPFSDFTYTYNYSQGELAGGSSAEIDMEYYLNYGFDRGVLYTDDWVLETNDLEDPTTIITINAEIAGVPELELERTNYNLDAYLGSILEDTLTISNVGSGLLTISSIVSDSELVALGYSSIEIQPYSSAKLPFSINITELLDFDAVITLTSDDPNNASHEMNLFVSSFLAPEIGLDLESIELTLYESQIDSVAVTVENTGEGALSYYFVNEPTKNEAVVLSTSEVFTSNQTQLKSKEEIDNETDFNSISYVSDVVASTQSVLGTTTTLEEVLESLNENYTAVNSLVPNRYDFYDGETGYSIGDGGDDMYDWGNYLETNFGGYIPYTNGEIETSSYLNNKSYFTVKYDGLFVLTADVSELNYFNIDGGLGADGYGSVDGAELSMTIGGKEYLGFVKRVYDAFYEPSVNHLIIVENNGQVNHDFETNSNYDDHSVNDLDGIDRLYYLLFASSDGGYVDNVTMLEVMETFLKLVEIDENHQLEPSGSEVDYIPFTTVDLDTGVYTYHVEVLSNDPDNSIIEIPTTLTVLSSAVVDPSIDSLIFENAYVGSIQSMYFQLKNSGSDTLFVDDISFSNEELFFLDHATDTILSGQSGYFEVLFYPTEIGTYYEELIVLSSDRVNPSYALPIRAEGVASSILTLNTNYIVDTLNLGGTGQVTFDIANTGTEPLNYRMVVNESTTYQSILARIEYYRTQSGVYDKEIEVPAHAALDGTIADAHTLTAEEVAGTVVSTGGGNILVIASAYSSEIEDVVAVLSDAETFGLITYVNTNYGFYMTLDDMSSYDAVFLFDRYGHNNAEELGDVLADYVDAGGGVVTALYESTSHSIAGRWEDEIDRYSVYNNQLFDSESYYYEEMGTVHLPDHELMEGVNTFDGGYYSYRTEATIDDIQEDADLIASWEDGSPLIIVKELGNARRVDLGFYPVSSDYSYSYWNRDTDGQQIMVNALNYVAVGGVSGSELDWVTLSSYEKDSLGAGERIQITASLDADEQGESWKAAKVSIYSNDSRLNFQSLQIDLFTDGISSLVVSDTLDFGIVTIGYAASASLSILNEGGGKSQYVLKGDTLGLFSGGFYDTLSLSSFTVANRLLNFEASELGETYEILEIENLTDGQNIEIVLAANVVSPGVIRLNPDLVHLELDYQDEVQSQFTIHNDGEADLNFELSTFYLQSLVASSSLSNNTSLLSLSTPTKGTVDLRKGHAIVNGMGSDDYGYIYVDSDEEGGPDYLWQDISNSGELVILGDDDSYYLALPFDFVLYGLSQSALYISSNGFISFDENAASNPINQQIPSGVSPNGLLSGFWKDLSPDIGGSVYYQLGDDQLIVQYDNVPDYEGTGTYTFQIHLYASGDVIYYYEDMNGVTDDATVGLEHVLGNQGLQVAFNTDYIKDQLAVQIVHPELRIKPEFTTGTVAPGDSVLVPFIYRSLDDLGGSYLENLLIVSNDTINPVSQLDISYYVTGPSSIEAYSDTLVFDTTYVNQVHTRYTSFENDNIGELKIDSASSSTDQFDLLFPNYSALLPEESNSYYYNISFDTRFNRVSGEVIGLDDVVAIKLVLRGEVTKEITDLSFETIDDSHYSIYQTANLSEEELWQLARGNVYLEIFTKDDLDGVVSHAMVAESHTVDPYGNSYSFRMLFKPQQVASDTAIISVYNNSVDNPIYEFMTIGNGLISPSTIEVSIDQLTETLAVNDSSEQVFTIRNTGEDSLTIRLGISQIKFESNLNPIELKSNALEIAASKPENDGVNKWLAPQRSEELILKPTSTVSEISIETELGSMFYSHLYGDYNFYMGYGSVDSPEDFEVISNVEYSEYAFGSEYVFGSSTLLYNLTYYGTLSLTNLETEEEVLLNYIYGDNSWTGMTTDPVMGTLYATTSTSLYKIDTDTYSVQLIGSYGYDNMIAIAMNSSGNLYGYSTDDEFLSINPKTGEASYIGYIGFDAVYIQDMAYDYETDKVYMAAYSYEAGAELREIDLTSGSTTLLGALATNYSSPQLISMAFPLTDVNSIVSISISDTVLASGQSIAVTTSFNTLNLNNGKYTSSISVLSNDYSNPELVIPVVLNVTGNQAKIGEFTNELNFGLITVYDTIRAQIEFQNVGNEVLVLNLHEVGEVFQMSDPKNDSIRIDIGGMISVDIQFVPTEAQTYTSELIWTTNDPDTPEMLISLSGAGQRSSVELLVSNTDFSFESHRDYEMKDSLSLSSIGKDSVFFSLTKELGVDWFTIVEDTSYIQSDSLVSYELSLSSGGLNVGTYESYLVLQSNDPYYDSLLIPISFNIINREPEQLVKFESYLLAIDEDSISFDLSECFSDPDGDSLTYEITSSTQKINMVSDQSILSVWGMLYGEDALNLVVVDGHGGELVASMDMFSNTRPMVMNSIDELYITMDGEFKESLYLADYFLDLDEDRLSIAIDSSGIAEFILSEDHELLIKGVEAGVDTISLTVSDGYHTINEAFRLVVDKEELRMFPNPATDYFTVNFPIDLKDELELRLIDVSGNLVKTWETTPVGDNNFELFIADIQPGMYLLEIYDGETRVSQDRIMKKE